MTPPLIVIGVCGEAFSGKDTVANHMIHANGFFRVALADGVRESLGSLDGPTWQIRKELDANGKDTVRWPQQTLGGDCREGVDESAYETWVNIALLKIRYLSEFHPVPRRRFVIPDIRHEFEPKRLHKIIRHLKGHFRCWKIERPGFGLTGVAGQHKSETSVRHVVADTVIRNHLDLGYLFGQVDTALDRVLEDAK